MKDLAKLVIVLTVICLVAGLMLAWVNRITEEPIRQAYAKERTAALRKVLPPCDAIDTNQVFVAHADGKEWKFQLAYRDGERVGAAFEATSPAGYGGDIVVMVGLNAKGNVQGIEILRQKETPGLGARIEEPAFKSGFADRSVRRSRWAVKKDQGDIDEITAATISSRAVVTAVKRGLDVYMIYEEKILGQGRQTQKKSEGPTGITGTLLKLPQALLPKKGD